MQLDAHAELARHQGVERPVQRVHRPHDAVREPERPRHDRQHEDEQRHARDHRAASQKLTRVADRLVRPEELRADLPVAHLVLNGERREDRHQEERRERDDPAQLPGAMSGVVVQQAKESHRSASSRAPHSSSDSS